MNAPVWKPVIRAAGVATLLALATAGGGAANQSAAAAPPAAPQAAPAAPSPAAAPPAAAGPALSAEQARNVLETLNDPKRRAALIATLEAIVKAAPPAAAPAAAAPSVTPAAAAPAAAPAVPGADGAAQAPAEGQAAAPALPLPLKPDSLGARLLMTASGLVGRASDQIAAAVSAMSSLPSLWAWLVVITTDPWGRHMLLDTGWRLVAVFAAGIAAEYALRWLLRRPRAALAAIGARRLHEEVVQEDAPMRAPGGAPAEAPAGGPAARPRSPWQWRASARGMLRRLPLTLGRLCLDIVPVVGFLVMAHLVLSTAVGGELGTRLVLIALAAAYALCAAILAVVHSLFAPAARGLRLFDVSDEFAADVVRWTRRIAVVAVFGYALGEAGLLLGLSPVAHEGLMKGVGLVVHILIGIVIIQSRRVVRDWIRPPPGRTGLLAQLRQRFADYWYWIALFYLAALWIVWAIEIPDGFTAILRIFGLTLLVFIVARIVVIVMHGSLDRLVTPRPETLAKYPDLEGRLRMWRPILHAMVDIVIYAIVLIELLEVWGFGAVRWLIGTDLGWHLITAFSTLLLTIAVAMLVWEAANHAIERHLSRLTRSAQLARSARLRTLLPMLRTVLLVTILVVVAMLVLSEIGLNVAPLIAGASVLGIAIGFGSQKLVQDVITGLFLLLENTVQVGDVVSLGGLSGVVEDLSVRTIRLRSEDGSVHVIPFSAVTTVTNMTRDFGHAVIEVGVAYKENYDRVVQVMRDIVTQMRTEPRWEDEIRDDLEVLGLNAFADSSVMIKARIKCGPFGRWSLLREFNRRLKERFDAEGIEIPFPHQQLVLTDPITLASRPASRGGDASDRPIAAQ